MKTYTIAIMALLGTISAIDLKTASKNVAPDAEKKPVESEMLDLDLEKELDDDDADLSDDELLIGNTDDEGDSADEDNDIELNDEDEDDLLEKEAKDDLAHEESKPADKTNVQTEAKYSEIPASMVGSDALGSYSRTTPARYT